MGLPQWPIPGAPFEQKNDLELHFLMLDTTQENFLFVFSGILRVLDVLGAKKN